MTAKSAQIPSPPLNKDFDAAARTKANVEHNLYNAAERVRAPQKKFKRKKKHE